MKKSIGEFIGADFVSNIGGVGFSEPSENTSEGKVLLLAGKVNPGNTGYSVEITYKQDILISAEYGNTVIIEWNGAAFRQMK